jgi:TP901 family phage tail tape measure protein
MSMDLNIKANADFSQVEAQLAGFRRKLSSKDFSQPLGRISGDAAEFRKSLEAATARVTAFGLTAGAIYKVSEAIRAGAKATIEVDKQLVELNTFLGQSKDQLEGFSRSLFKVARNAAVPFEAATEAAKEFARQGLSTNEVLKRTEDALTLARISGINYGDAVNGITTAINSFNKEALSSTEIINKLIAVDSRFAVSSAQLNEALTRVGSSAEESGISIDKLIATVTAAQQITGRGGAVIGNALKTIFTRLQRPEVLTQLQQLGVSIKDQNGFLLDGISILKNYADATKNLSQIEKSRTAELIGGIYQINQVNALIKDLSSSNSVYAEALRTSSSAIDEAKRKNEELNKSMSALLQTTKTQAQEAAAVLGKSILEPMVRIGSDFTKEILKIVNPESNLLGEAEKGGESLGTSFAKGAASVLGKTLAVGGIPLAVGVGGTLLTKMAKFGVNSVRNISKDYQSIFSEKTLLAQERVNDLLRQNPSLISDVQKGTLSLTQVEAKLLDLIRLQNRELATQAAIRARVVPTVVAKGGSRKIIASGYIPNFSMSDAEEEVYTAKNLGAKNPRPRVIQATIKGKTGPVMVNSEEDIVPNFAGTGETAIIPNYRNLSEIPRTAAAGYIPNFAKQRLGGGFFGEFFKLRGSLGRKDFFDPKSEITKSNVANEFVAGQELNQMIGAGALNPIFGSPAIYGSLSKSIKKSQIYKGIVSGRTGKDIAEGLDEYTGEKKGFEKILNLMLSRAQFQIDMGGRMKALDLVGKPENVILNEKTEGILSKISRRKYDKLLKSVDSKDFEQGEAQVDRIMSAIAKKGGQISILDPGIFELGSGLAKKRTKGLSDLGYRDKFSFSGGFIPNFASSKFVQNIVDSYKASLTEKDPIRFNAAQKQEKYYNNVNSELKNLSASSGYSVEKLAYGLAALSGNTADSQARKALERIANNKPYDDLVVLPNNVKKVKEMLTSSGSTEELKSILGKGAKTQNFAQSLLLLDKFSGFGNYKNPIGTPSVMDSWAIYVRNGGALKNKYDRGAVSASQKSKVFAQSKKGYNYYNKLVKEYGEAAEILGVPVRELQARTWGWARTQMGSRSRNDSFASGYVPNFSMPRIVGQGSNLFVSSLYDALSGEYGGGPEYPFVRPGMGAAFLKQDKTQDMIKLIKPFVESGSRVIFGPQAGRMGGDLGLIQGLAGNKMVVEKLKAAYPKLTSKFIQEGSSTANLTVLFNKFYKTLGPNKMREIVSPFIEPDILKFYQKNKNFGSSISRLAEFGKESLVEAPYSQHSIYPNAIKGKALSRIDPINAQELFKIAGNLSNKEVLKLMGTLRVAKLPIGFRWEKGDAASKLLGLSSGYIPNFAGLSDAVSREKTMSGLPASQIMTHFDGKGNPIAVTNKRDEPNGLRDVPNFAKVPSGLIKSAGKFFNKVIGGGSKAVPANPENPISGSFQLLAAQTFTQIFDELAEREIISPGIASKAAFAIPLGLGAKNIGKGLFGKGLSKTGRVLTTLTGLAQAGGGAYLASQTTKGLEQRIEEKKMSEEIDRAKRSFQNLTENTTELAATLSKLDAAYKDPKADPKEISKLVKNREDILKKITIKNPDLVSKLAGQESISGKIDILEENQREAQRVLSLKESAAAFKAKGNIPGKEAPEQLASFFEEAINRAKPDLFRQDFTGATPANFAEILKKGGLDIKEFSSIFNTDDLKKSFIASLKLAQELQAISSQQEQDLRAKNRPLAQAQQRVTDAREIRGEIKKVLEQQLPELASFAGGFSKRAGISAGAEGSLAIKKADAAVAFQNSLLAQLNDKEFLKGLPSGVEKTLRNIESPGESTAKELQKLETLPGLSKEQILGIQRLIDFNSQQTRDLTKATIIAEETKKIQLKFLALQEKAAFGGDIRTSINSQMRAEAMNAGIRGPLTYQLGGMIGSRRSQIAGTTDFITDTLQRYPGLLMTKEGKEPGDIKAVKGELTRLNALDMQKDLLKRAGMAQMMGLGQTASLLQGKAFDQKYLFESAGLKASALFESPEVPKEVQDAMKDYEKFNVRSARASKEEDQYLRRKEEEIIPAKESIAEQASKTAKELAEKFEAALKSTFGTTGVTTTSMNVTATGDVKFSKNNGSADAGVPSSANGLTKYSSSISDAISREKVALANRGIMGVPNFSMASINLERSPDLVTPSNPQGFGVTNSIDEKRGLRSLGMRSSGFVPNFAKSRMEELLERIYGPRADAPKPVVPSAPAPILGVSQKTMPFYPERLVNETYPYGSNPSIGNVNPTARPQKSLPKRDSVTGRFLSKSQADLMEKIEQGKLAKAAKKAQLAQGSPSGFSSLLAKPGLQQMLALTPEEQARIRRGAFESSQRAGAAQMAEYQRVFLAQKASELQPSKPSTGLRLAERGSISAPLFTGKERGPRPMITLSGGKQPASPAGQLFGTIGQETGPRPKIILPGGQKPAGKIPKSSGGTQYSLLARGQGTSQSFIGAVSQAQQQNILAQARSSLSSVARGKTILPTVFTGASLTAPSPGVQPPDSGSTLQLAQKSNVKPSVSAPALQQPQPGVINQIRSGLQLKGQGGYTTPSLRLSNYRAASAGTGSYLDAFLVGNEENFKLAAENERQAAVNRYFERTAPQRAEMKAFSEAEQARLNKRLAKEAADKIRNRQRIDLSDVIRRYGKSAFVKGRSANLRSVIENIDTINLNAGASNFKEYTPEEVKNILSKKPSAPSASIITPKTSGILGKVKSTAGIALKGLGVLGGAAEAYDAYRNIQGGNYGQAALSGASSALSFASLLGGTVGSVAGGIGLAYAVGTGGYKLGNILEEKIGLGEKLGSYFSGSAATMAEQAGRQNLKEMSSKKAYDSDQIISRKMQLLQEANRYNRVSGYPSLSFGSGLARSTAAQERKNEQDLELLKDRLDKESEASKAAMNARVAGRVAIEQDRMAKETANQENEQSSKLRKSFLESFSQNAESAGYLTTRDKVNYLLSQEGKNGLGEFQASDFGNDTDLFRSYFNYKKEKERVPNFAAMSNSMMSSGDVYSRMRSSSPRSSMTSYSGGYVPNFAAGDFTNAITEALKNGITSAFPNGASSSNVSNSNVINIDGRTSIQNAPDEAMQGIISILFDKIPELKKLGPTALNFKR